MYRIVVLSLIALSLTNACKRSDSPPADTPMPLAGEPVAASGAKSSVIDTAALMRHIEVLSSDEFEGRAPASPGEDKTVAYLAEQFAALGVRPGNGDSYFQPVPLVTITAEPAVLTIARDGVVDQLMQFGPDVVMGTRQVTESVSVQGSELVFVGYGIVAPEYEWDDYAGLDVQGKTVVILVNDPGFASQDEKLFKGNAMTYYGRWTYKFEEAARQGAAAALVVHETAPASYPWSVVQSGWSGPQHTLVTADKNMSRCEIEGWISLAQAEILFANAGLDYQQARDRAKKPGFVAVPLGATASASLVNDISYSDSRNVLGLIPGSTRANEYVVFMAHWDHLGMDTTLEGDQIYNGAVDNASGTAALLVLAKAFMNAPVKPGRSILFIAVTAEESGLLGSLHYAENPVYPLARTVAGINIDSLNVYGRTRDVAVVGYGSSELEKYLAREAAKQQRNIVPETAPEKGSFYRSDHFSLAKKGVPMLYAKSGNDYLAGGKEAGARIAKEHTSNRYHKPADEINEMWELAGAIEDLELYYGLVERISLESTFVKWYPGTEFRAIREADLAAHR